MTKAELAELRAQVLIRTTARGTAYVRAADLVSPHREGFWAFTGAQSCFQDDEGFSAIPASAWLEYTEWLGEDDASPETANTATKTDWRLKHGRPV